MSYVIRPQADRDLEEQAYYYATVASPAVGHRFLLAAHDTFALLAAQPNIGWHRRLKRTALKSLRIFRVKGFENTLIFYLPKNDGVDILRVIHGSRNLDALWRRGRLK